MGTFESQLEIGQRLGTKTEYAQDCIGQLFRSFSIAETHLSKQNDDFMSIENRRLMGKQTIEVIKTEIVVVARKAIALLEFRGARVCIYCIVD